MLHDNKGTPNNPKDDMTIGPLTNLEYDEPTQQITTDSHVVIEDAEMVTSGDRMLIQLRKNDSFRGPVAHPDSTESSTWNYSRTFTS